MMLNRTTGTSLATLNSYDIMRSASAQTPDVEFYWDRALTKPLTEIDWGEMFPGGANAKSIWCKNIAAYSIILLSIDTEGWNPANAKNYLRLSGSYDKHIIQKGTSKSLTLTLSISTDVDRNITNFSFQIPISTTQASRLDMDHEIPRNGQVDMNDLVTMLKHFGAQNGDTNYSVDYDINLDGKITTEDFIIEMAYFGQTIS
jgi:hypothetical protein